MNYWRRWEITGVLIAATVVIGAVESRRPVNKAADEALKHRVELLQDSLARTITRAQADGATVYVRTQSVRLLRDTLLLHMSDTTYIRTYIWATDSALDACDALRRSCLVLGATADSTVHAYQRRVASLESQLPHWWDRCGVGPSYSAVRAGREVVAGFGVSASCRVWP